MSRNDPVTLGSTTVAFAIALATLTAGLVITASPTAATEDDSTLCDRPLDIMFVMDTSNSMRNELPNGKTRMEVARNGAVGLANKLSPDDTSGVVNFSKGANVDKSLDGHHGPTTSTGSTAYVLNNLAITPPNGETWTDKGIETAQEELEQNGRAGVPNVMVLLTDGRPYPTWRTSPTIDAADAAKEAGTEIFAIGVEAPSSIMEEIASDPDEMHYFDASTEDEVLDAFDAIRSSLYRGEVRGESYAVRASAEGANAEVDVGPVNQYLLPPGGSGPIETVTVTTSNPPLKIEANVAHGATDGQTTKRSADAHALTTIHRLRVTDTSTSTTLVSADLLRSESYSNATATSAWSTDGRTALAELHVKGYSQTIQVSPNTVIPLAGVGTLTLNEQIHQGGPGASSLRVNAIHLALDAGTSPDTTTDVIIGSAYSGAFCGVRAPPVDDAGNPPVDVAPPDEGPGVSLCLDNAFVYLCLQDAEPCALSEDPETCIETDVPCLRLGGYQICPDRIVDGTPAFEPALDPSWIDPGNATDSAPP